MFYYFIGSNALFSDFPDVFIPKPKGEITERNGSIALECFVKAVPDCNIYSWTHFAPDNVTKVQEYGGINKHGVLRLQLNDISYMDTGLYICNVSNGIKDYRTYESFATNDLHLVVKGLYRLFLALIRVSQAELRSFSIHISCFEPSIAF